MQQPRVSLDQMLVWGQTSLLALLGCLGHWPPLPNTPWLFQVHEPLGITCPRAPGCVGQALKQCGNWDYNYGGRKASIWKLILCNCDKR